MAGKAPGRNTVGGAEAPAGGGTGAPLPAGGSGLVIAIEGGERFLLGGASVLVGRAPDNDLVLAEPSVSARHARIDLEADGAFLTDLGSTNGTYLAGRRITGSVPVAIGDTVQFGRITARVEEAPPEATVEGDSPPSAAAPPLRSGAVIPAKRSLRLLTTFDQADAPWGERIVERLERIGHDVAVDRSNGGDGWAGRLLDLMWTRDAVLFVVSAAAATSERVHREVHLAGAEHTTVIPVVVGDADLPDDLAFYLERHQPVDLRRDPAAGLSELQARLDTVRPKRVARPWQLARRVAVVIAVLVLVALAYRLVRG